MDRERVVISHEVRDRMHKEDTYAYNDVSRQPAITHTCRILRHELLPFFYAENKFIVPLGRDAFPVFQWLIVIGEANRRRTHVTLREYDYSSLNELFGRPRRLLCGDDRRIGVQFGSQYEGYASKIKMKLGKISAINRNCLEGHSYWEARLITSDS